MLKGKTAVVTGGTRGIGRAIALCLAAEGANVALIATRETDGARDTLREILERGVRGVLVSCDVSSAEATDMAVKQIISELGCVDILVNNAGITRDKLLMQMTEEDFDSVISVNLKGCFNMTRALVRHMAKNRYGRIVNISSVVGLMGNAGQANYAASKAGIIGFTKSVAKEYAQRGITCNAVAPGYIETDMTAAMNEAQRGAILESVPARRAGAPEEVAALVAFLASDSAAYITGETIRVDGGMYI